jgi:hypothetical protein
MGQSAVRASPYPGSIDLALVPSTSQNNDRPAISAPGLALKSSFRGLVKGASLPRTITATGAPGKQKKQKRNRWDARQVSPCPCDGGTIRVQGTPFPNGFRDPVGDSKARVPSRRASREALTAR